MRRLLIAVMLVAAANAQVRDRVISSAPQGAVNRGYSGVQAQSQHHDDGDSVQVGVQVGTGIRDTIRFDRPRDHRNRGNIFYGNRCYRCSLSGAYHNPYYAMPVYVERYDGPDSARTAALTAFTAITFPKSTLRPARPPLMPRITRDRWISASTH